MHGCLPYIKSGAVIKEASAGGPLAISWKTKYWSDGAKVYVHKKISYRKQKERVSDKARFKPACSATETSQKLSMKFRS